LPFYCRLLCHIFGRMPKPAAAAEGGGKPSGNGRSFGQGAARTILPELSLHQFARFDLGFTPGCETGNTGFTVEDWQQGDSITLTAGIWDLRIDAFMAEDVEHPTAQGGLSGIRVLSGETVNSNVVLYPVTDGEGTFSWKGIRFPENVVTAVMEIAKWIDGSVGDILYAVNLVADGSTTDDRPYRVLPAGQHIVIFTLYSESGERVEISDILHVYRNIETELSPETFADFIFPVSLLRACSHYLIET